MVPPVGFKTYLASALFVALLLGIWAFWIPPRRQSVAPKLAASHERARARVVAPKGEHAERALGLAWGGWAESAFDASALSKPHTLVVRFMPQFEAAFRGVLVSDGTGRCRLGMAPYGALNAPAVEVAIGGVTLTSPLPDPVTSDGDFRFGPKPAKIPRWRHLAITSHDGNVSLYLDGSRAASLAADAKSCRGPLHFGRLPQKEAIQDQFYGFIDDVALFDAPLSEPEIRALARVHRIEPNLSGLIAAWTFDEGSVASEGVQKSMVLKGSAAFTRVSRNREALADARLLPRPNHRTRLSLPFESGQAWLVIQGVDSALSHHDIASFAMDFLRIDPAFVRNNRARVPGGSHAWTAGRPVLAAASGEISARVDCFFDDNSGGCSLGARAAPAAATQPLDPSHRNLVCVTHAREETSCYLHLAHRSATTVPVGQGVASGARVGSVGRTGAPKVHLHFALGDVPEPTEPGRFSDLVTRPFEFNDYFVSDDFGRSWQRVEVGTPVAGQWIARGVIPAAF